MANDYTHRGDLRQKQATKRCRVRRAVKLRSLQELREDYELMLIECDLQKKRFLDIASESHELNVNSSSYRFNKSRSRIRRASSLLSYNIELEHALRLNIATVDRKASEVIVEPRPKG